MKDLPKEESPNVEETIFSICVVALDRTAGERNTYKNFYLCIKGSREEASHMQDEIAKRGFKTEGQRVFPGDIETITLKEKDE